MKEYAQAMRPDFFVHGGDISDWDFLASFNRDKLRLLGGKTFVAEYEVIGREFDWWRELVPGDMIVCLGNHDERVYDAIDRSGTLEGLVEFENQLDLSGIQLYRQIAQPVRVGKLGVLHGWFHNKYHTNKHLEEYTGNLLYGHVHKRQLKSKVLYGTGGQEIEAQSIGCLCDKNPEWLRGKPSHWQHMFAVIYLMDNGDFEVFPLHIIRNRFIAPDGAVWTLKEAVDGTEEHDPQGESESAGGEVAQCEAPCGTSPCHCAAVAGEG